MTCGILWLATLQFETKLQKCIRMGITIFKIFIWAGIWSDIWIRNCIIHLSSRGAVKHDFRPYMGRYTSPNENFEYGYPYSNALLQFELKLERCKPYEAAHLPRKCDIVNDVKLFPAVYRRIYCRKFLTLSIRGCVANSSALESKM